MEDRNRAGGGQRHFPHLKHYLDHYAPPGLEDKRAVHVFMDCETTESINTLRNEIRIVANGQYDENALDRTVGKGRQGKFSSYDNWGKLMLMWMAEYKG